MPHCPVPILLTLHTEPGCAQQPLSIGCHSGCVAWLAAPYGEAMAQPTPGHLQPLTGYNWLPIQLPCHRHVLGGHHALEGGIVSLQHHQALQLHNDLHHSAH